jgi:hypothetical protein
MKSKIFLKTAVVCALVSSLWGFSCIAYGEYLKWNASTIFDVPYFKLASALSLAFIPLFFGLIFLFLGLRKPLGE